MDKRNRRSKNEKILERSHLTTTPGTSWNSPRLLSVSTRPLWALLSSLWYFSFKFTDSNIRKTAIPLGLYRSSPWVFDSRFGLCLQNLGPWRSSWPCLGITQFELSSETISANIARGKCGLHGWKRVSGFTSTVSCILWQKRNPKTTSATEEHTARCAGLQDLVILIDKGSINRKQ